jgi:hypothetical protein
MDSNLVPISHVPRRIAELTGVSGISPRKVYDLVLRGSIPADFINGRWYVADGNMNVIAETLSSYGHVGGTTA